MVATTIDNLQASDHIEISAVTTILSLWRSTEEK